MNNILSKRSLRIAAAVAVCGFCVVKAIQAFNPQPDPPAFALVGMTPSSQFMRLNVSNVPIPGLTFGGSCEVALMFADDQGNSLKRSMITLAVGQSAHLDLTRTDLGLDRPPRVEILPSLVRGGSCVLSPSVEVVDAASGHTDVYVVRAAMNHNETLVQDSE